MAHFDSVSELHTLMKEGIGKITFSHVGGYKDRVKSKEDLLMPEKFNTIADAKAKVTLWSLIAGKTDKKSQSESIHSIPGVIIGKREEKKVVSYLKDS